jgi:hypothetical protein
VKLDVCKSPAYRRCFIGGSDARIIMGDDEAALLRLWQEKRGELEPEDLSANLIVQLGVVTEPLNRHRYPERHAQCASAYLWFLAVRDLRRRTPGPPPFSLMNSTPARLSTSSILASVVASPAYRPTSILVMVFRWRPVASARSRTVQFSAARAILTCALVIAHDLCYCHMCQCHNNQ